MVTAKVETMTKETQSACAMSTELHPHSRVLNNKNGVEEEKREDFLSTAHVHMNAECNLEKKCIPVSVISERGIENQVLKTVRCFRRHLQFLERANTENVLVLIEAFDARDYPHCCLILTR